MKIDGLNFFRNSKDLKHDICAMNQSCRACGTDLSPKMCCKVCNETISWVCKNCDRMDDVTHLHNLKAKYVVAEVS